MKFVRPNGENQAAAAAVAVGEARSHGRLPATGKVSPDTPVCRAPLWPAPQQRSAGGSRHRNAGRAESSILSRATTWPLHARSVRLACRSVASCTGHQDRRGRPARPCKRVPAACSVVGLNAVLFRTRMDYRNGRFGVWFTGTGVSEDSRGEGCEPGPGNLARVCLGLSVGEVGAKRGDASKGSTGLRVRRHSLSTARNGRSNQRGDTDE